MFRTVAALIVCILLLPACGSDRNQPPTVEASASANEVAVGEQVTVDGTQSSDPDGDPLLFRWSLDAPEQSAVAIDDLRTDTITFAPDVAGTYTVYLTVDDGEFESARANVTIEASGTGAPVVDAGPDQSVEIGAEVTLDGTNSSDPNGDDLTYQWTFDQPPQGSTAEFSDPTAAQPTFVADVAGDFIILLVVSDGELTSESDTVIVSVGGEGNQPPVADAGGDQTVTPGVEVVLDGTASSDSDSSQLTYFWEQVVPSPSEIDVGLSGATTSTARFTPTQAGVYEFELTVSDGELDDTDTVSVTVEGSLSSVCLLISEYIENGFTKGIEIYNCSGQEVDLSGFGLCMVRGGDTSCSESIGLSGQVPDEEVRTICYGRSENELIGAGLCDMETNDLTHTGDDSLFIYENVDGTEGFGSSDLVVDAFGDIEEPPSSEDWDDLVLRRCDFTRLNGLYPEGEGFVWPDYFVAADDVTDHTQFGQPPVPGCP
jgi:hypothetical protein